MGEIFVFLLFFFFFFAYDNHKAPISFFFFPFPSYSVFLTLVTSTNTQLHSHLKQAILSGDFRRAKELFFFHDMVVCSAESWEGGNRLFYKYTCCRQAVYFSHAFGCDVGDVSPGWVDLTFPCPRSSQPASQPAWQAARPSERSPRPAGPS